MGYPGKERQQQLRAAKGAKGKKVIREERRAARAALAQGSSSSVAGPSFGAATFDFSAQQQLVFRPRVTATDPAASILFSSAAAGDFAAPSTNEAPPADDASRSHAVSQQTFAARIAAVAARCTGGCHNRRSRVPNQKERLSRRSVFRDLAGVPLAALGLGHNIGGSVAADIVGNWPSEVLGEELLGSDDEEEEDMEDDDDEMADVGYHSDIYDSD
ncbi:hypothetical protein BHYA_0131g00010 [Botrytis hyacinthi]|uniref:Uncharacterized protein n=1 Tax=Botrytis hyacinthi TaxID=278943 RepID=A0A4Z1GRF5_9HELO|nr:hypothetical protein BHYA_0131g00010 [Botrytis hyacinthi]